jgi:hypothetical protein
MSPGLVRRFIFMTGDALGTGTREFIESVGASSVSKPFDLEELRRVIRRALECPGGAA